jgi:hypothetical protein
MAKKRTIKWHDAPLGPGQQNAYVGRCRLIVYVTGRAGTRPSPRAINPGKPYGWSIRDKHLTETFATGTTNSMRAAKTAAVARARRICK